MDDLAVFIVCLFILVVSQWEEDVEQWCSASVIIAHSKSPDKEWKMNIMKRFKRFKRDGAPFVCITTNDTFASDEIQQYLKCFNDSHNVLLIVDEAHKSNIRRKFSSL